MAIATYSDYRNKISAPFQSIRSNVNGFSYGGFNATLLGKSVSHWNADGQGPTPGAVPSTAAAPTRATAGALGQQNSSGVLRIGQMLASVGAISTSDASNGTYVLYDRLSHQGGLSGTVTTAQTTNLPTAALTRYTTGDGVMFALEIYTSLGNTATTVTASYTNQAGTAGKVTPARSFGSIDGSQAFFLPMPLASGDSGVRAVASVTVLASTGTAGNFGVTLYKPLYAVPSCGGLRSVLDGVVGAAGNIPQVQTDACLCWFSLMVDSATRGGSIVSSSGRLSVVHTLVEE